jgi:hypothetical protein
MGDVFEFKRNEVLWERKYSAMAIIELMEEMVKYKADEEKSGLTLAMMGRGVALFGYIETRCNTPELRLLASSYRRHLEHEKINLVTKNRTRS